NHIERKEIGIYGTEEYAKSAVVKLKNQMGFCDAQDGFKIKKVFRFFKPKLLDKTFWAEGFETYTY
ncbi:MAG: hypothetical protein IKC37_03130, partial [Clostridia bacterium]|nr:hypothetical protein [Clostridia bacterium]